jgi:hypothetical protein
MGRMAAFVASTTLADTSVGSTALSGMRLLQQAIAPVPSAAAAAAGTAAAEAAAEAASAARRAAAAAAAAAAVPAAPHSAAAASLQLQSSRLRLLPATAVTALSFAERDSLLLAGCADGRVLVVAEAPVMEAQEEGGELAEAAAASSLSEAMLLLP